MHPRRIAFYRGTIFFRLYSDNYVTATDYLADMGVRYTFTGHVHAIISRGTPLTILTEY